MIDAPVFDAVFGEQLDQLFRVRRDVRHFRPEPLPEDDVRALLDVAALAPSVGNAQPWRFIRLRSASIRKALISHVDETSSAFETTLSDVERCNLHARLKLHALREAPEILAVFSEEDPVAGHGLGRATMPETLCYSTVMAIHTLWLFARAREIGVGWVSILDPVAVSALLDAPASWKLIAILCIGYPLEASTVPELERRGWQAREPVSDRIFER